jgi:hypothetical protein
MKNLGMNIRHAKQRGEWAELRFMTRATELGFIVAKPWGDSAPFDLALAYRGHFVRVQVKCTLFKRDNSYQCSLTANHILYTPAQIDFFAAYVIPADVFYILPLAATHNQPDIILSPHRKKSKYAQYKEAWHLLMSEAPKP